MSTPRETPGRDVAVAKALDDVALAWELAATAGFFLLRSLLALR